jgi:hypothetical protein
MHPSNNTPKSSRSIAFERRDSVRRSKRGCGPLKPPSAGELRRSLDLLVTQLDRHRRRGQRGWDPARDVITLGQLCRVSADDLEARDLVADPIGIGLMSALRNVARLLARRVDTLDELRRMIEDIALRDIERPTTRLLILDHALDGVAVKNGARWVA